jgi:uncharacterized paraquat-inducible protein A
MAIAIMIPYSIIYTIMGDLHNVARLKDLRWLIIMRQWCKLYVPTVKFTVAVFEHEVGAKITIPKISFGTQDSR